MKMTSRPHTPELNRFFVQAQKNGTWYTDDMGWGNMTRLISYDDAITRFEKYATMALNDYPEWQAVRLLSSTYDEVAVSSRKVKGAE